MFFLWVNVFQVPCNDLTNEFWQYNVLLSGVPLYNPAQSGVCSAVQPLPGQPLLAQPTLSCSPLSVLEHHLLKSICPNNPPLYNSLPLSPGMAPSFPAGLPKQVFLNNCIITHCQYHPSKNPENCVHFYQLINWYWLSPLEYKLSRASTISISLSTLYSESNTRLRAK